MEYNIEGLTRKQIMMLDIMWTIEDEQSVENFIRSLPAPDRQQAQSLKTLLVHEMLEEWLEGVSEYPEVRNIIDEIK